jgi:folate-binding protein YgfZ
MPEPMPLHAATAGAGAAFAEEAGFLVPAHFGAPEAEYGQARTGAALFDVSHRGKVEVTGTDAVPFLHNLSTADVKALAAGAGSEAFFCTSTAKVVAHAFLYREPPHGKREALALDLPPGTSAKVLQHLDHFLISEDVAFADRTRELAQFHLAGPGAADALARLLGAAPDLAPLGHRAATLADVACALRRHDLLGLPGFDVLCPAGRAEGLWRRLLDAGARPAGRQAYEVLRVEAGAPLYGVDVDDTTFAPEVGRAPQAICYTKGCYLGQEPIVMARDRGQVNRTLLGLKLPDGPVVAGSRLHREGKEVGRVTSSVVSPRLGAVALGYVRRGSQAPGTALEVEAGGQRRPAVVAALPFEG